LYDDTEDKLLEHLRKSKESKGILKDLLTKKIKIRKELVNNDQDEVLESIHLK